MRERARVRACVRAEWLDERGARSVAHARPSTPTHPHTRTRRPACCQVLGSLEEDFVWIHDYHLLVLPSLLRKRFHRIK